MSICRFVLPFAFLLFVVSGKESVAQWTLPTRTHSPQTPQTSSPYRASFSSTGSTAWSKPTSSGGFSPSSTTPTHFSTLESNGLSVEVLSKNLYAKTPEENAFVTLCVKLRDEGALPNRILYTSYRYAIRKSKERRFMHFEQSLRRLCGESGISLSNSP